MCGNSTAAAAAAAAVAAALFCVYYLGKVCIVAYNAEALDLCTTTV